MATQTNTTRRALVSSLAALPVVAVPALAGEPSTRMASLAATFEAAHKAHVEALVAAVDCTFRDPAYEELQAADRDASEACDQAFKAVMDEPATTPADFDLKRRAFMRYRAHHAEEPDFPVEIERLLNDAAHVLGVPEKSFADFPVA